MRRAILLVAYGASNPHARSGLIKFELACRSRFPAYPIRWAFTSPLLRERIALQGQKSDSVSKALWRLHFENFQSVAVQPLQTLPGREFEDVKHAVELARLECGLKCEIGRPLLDAGMEAVTKALLNHIPSDRASSESVIFMGHGARHGSVVMYGELANALRQIDERAFIGTMSGELELEHILPSLASHSVWLIPLLSGIGLHALRDMAGSEPTSWKSRIERAGHKCQPVLKGMVESQDIANIWLNHLQAAIEGMESAY